MPDELGGLLTKLHLTGFPGGEQWSGEYYRAEDVEAELTALLARLAEVEEERDFAIAHAEQLAKIADAITVAKHRAAAERDEARAMFAAADRVGQRVAQGGDEAIHALAAEIDRLRQVAEAAEALAAARHTLAPLKIEALTPVINLLAAVDTWQSNQELPVCTCPWAHHAGRNGVGHHIACPTLRRVHTPDDSCGYLGHVDTPVDAGTVSPSGLELIAHATGGGIKNQEFTAKLEDAPADAGHLPADDYPQIPIEPDPYLNDWMVRPTAPADPDDEPVGTTVEDFYAKLDPLTMPEPADPSWLEGAIEAGWAAVDINGSGIEEAIRAAKPLIERGVLGEVQVAIDAKANATDSATVRLGLDRASDIVRDMRAARQVTS